MSISRLPLGHGVGLRTKHFARLLAEPVPVPFMEAVTENFLGAGGRPISVLEKVRRDVPVALHGVSLSVGGMDRFPAELVSRLRALASRLEAAWVSDHLCWGTHGGRSSHDLLPLPYTEEALAHVVARVGELQDRLGRQLLLENVSSYVEFRDSTMPEWTFLAEVARRADCGILLDLNNVYVSARNHGFDPLAYLDGVPGDRVAYFHLAGHSDHGTHLLDTHDHPVPDPVWALYREAVRRFGAVPSIVEWDDRIPELDELVAQSRTAQALQAEVLAETAA